MTPNETRTRIESFVADNPGVHFSAVVRRLDLAPGQVQYHLRRLRRAGAIERSERYGRTHFYPPDCDPGTRGSLAVLRRETARDVVVSLVRHGPSTPGEVVDRLGIARSTLEWHLDRLTAEGLVSKERDGRGHVTLVLAHPDEAAALLDTVDPSLPGRMADRFTRLVDGLLTE